MTLPPDAVVADLGAGTGYLAVRLAKLLPSGRVYAVDIEPDMVRYLAEWCGSRKLLVTSTPMTIAARPVQRGISFAMGCSTLIC